MGIVLNIFLLFLRAVYILIIRSSDVTPSLSISLSLSLSLSLSRARSLYYLFRSPASGCHTGRRPVLSVPPR